MTTKILPGSQHWNNIVDSFSTDNSTKENFELQSPQTQQAIVQEIYDRCQPSNQYKELASKLKVTCKVNIKDDADPILKPLTKLLLGDPTWFSELRTQRKHWGTLFKNVFIKQDPKLCKLAREWIQRRLLNADNEVLNSDLRINYVFQLLAYYPVFDPQPGEEITIPIGNGYLGTYQVERIELTPSSLLSPIVAYGLKPKNPENHPVLIFKGTTYPADKGAYLSILTDINPFLPVGGLVFRLFAKKRIDAWLQKNVTDKVAVVVGQSLGGSLTLQTVSCFPKKIGAAVAINTPASTHKVVNQWKKNTAGMKDDEKPKVLVPLQNKDPISKYVGTTFSDDWNLQNVFSAGQKGFQAHASTYASRSDAWMLPVKAADENKKCMRRNWFIMQNIVALPFFVLGVALMPLFILAHVIKSVILHLCKKKPKQPTAIPNQT